MKKIPFLLSVLFLSLPVWMQAQEKGFVLKGCLPGMRDGVKVALLGNHRRNNGKERMLRTAGKSGTPYSLYTDYQQSRPPRTVCPPSGFCQHRFYPVDVHFRLFG